MSDTVEDGAETLHRAMNNSGADAETNTMNDETDDPNPGQFDLTDRTAFHLEPIYATDEHAGIVLTESFEVIANSEAEAKQHVLDFSGRDSVEGWLDVTEHDARVPARRESGVIRLTEEQYYEMRRETDRHETACWICGPFDPGEIDRDARFSSPCPTCGMTTSMASLIEKGGTELRDGTSFIKKDMKALSDGGPSMTGTEEIILDMAGGC